VPLPLNRQCGRTPRRGAGDAAREAAEDAGQPGPGRDDSHSGTALCISLLILHTIYRGALKWPQRPRPQAGGAEDFLTRWAESADFASKVAMGRRVNSRAP
jgi:hypothetical protein